MADATCDPRIAYESMDWIQKKVAHYIVGLAMEKEYYKHISSVKDLLDKVGIIFVLEVYNSMNEEQKEAIEYFVQAAIEEEK